MRRHKQSAFCFVLAAFVSIWAGSPAAVEAGTLYTTTISGNTTAVWNVPSVWGSANYPGDGTETPLGSDTATVTFHDNVGGTANPKMDLSGGSYTIAGMTIVETGDNAAGDFLSRTGATGSAANATAGTLTVGQIVYESGNREIDFGFIARSLPTDVNGDPDMSRNLTIDGGWIVTSCFSVSCGIRFCFFTSPSILTFRETKGACSNVNCNNPDQKRVTRRRGQSTGVNNHQLSP